MKKPLPALATLTAILLFGYFYAVASPMPAPGSPMEIQGGPCEPGFGPPPGPGPAKVFEVLAVALDLTDTQQGEIKKILDEERTRHENLEQAIRNDERSLRGMLETGNFDEATFRAASQKIAENRVDMIVAGAKLKPQVLAVLTAEQRTKAEKIMQLMAPPPRGEKSHRPGPPEGRP